MTHGVEEALLMADRAIVFSPRPARIVADLLIEPPRPRHRDDQAVIALRRDVLALLGLAS